MRLTIRSAFAVALWSAAALPIVLIALASASPVAAVKVANALEHSARWVVLCAIAGGVGAALLWPPFLPAVRHAFRRQRIRLGTDQTALRESLARLEHLDIAADRLIAGRALLQLGRAADALPHLVRAVELDPDHAASRYALALALLEAGRTAEAVPHLERVVERDPGHAFGGALLELGVAREQLGDDERAIAALNDHERQFGPSRRGQFHRSRARLRRGDRDAALADLREAARPVEPGTRLTPEDDVMRAKARVALLRGGR